MNGTRTLPTTNRTASGLLAIALGAATSAFVVVAALVGHRFGVLDVAAILVVAAFILGLNLQQVPQRPLLRRLPDEWDSPVVIHADPVRGSRQGRGHAA